MRVSTVEQPARTKALSAVPGMSALEKNGPFITPYKSYRHEGVPVEPSIA
jgi:hypothetical protein